MFIKALWKTELDQPTAANVADNADECGRLASLGLNSVIDFPSKLRLLDTMTPEQIANARQVLGDHLDACRLAMVSQGVPFLALVPVWTRDDRNPNWNETISDEPAWTSRFAECGQQALLDAVWIWHESYKHSGNAQRAYAIDLVSAAGKQSWIYYGGISALWRAPNALWHRQERDHYIQVGFGAGDGASWPDFYRNADIPLSQISEASAYARKMAPECKFVGLINIPEGAVTTDHLKALERVLKWGKPYVDGWTIRTARPDGTPAATPDEQVQVLGAC